jgi:hypothetical protein
MMKRKENYYGWRYSITGLDTLFHMPHKFFSTVAYLISSYASTHYPIPPRPVSESKELMPFDPDAKRITSTTACGGFAGKIQSGSGIDTDHCETCSPEPAPAKAGDVWVFFSIAPTG